jgi:hypothetical protein
MPANPTSTAAEPARDKSRPRAVVLLSGVLLGIIAAAILVALMMRAQTGPLERLWSMLAGRSTHITSQPTVVERIRQLQRLETVVYSMDKIVAGEKDNPYLPDFLAGDHVLMLVHGEVVAGIDFSRLGAGDITVEGKTVRLRLPQPQVLITRVDEARTRVYSRQTGWLVKVDPNLETQVRQQAERELIDAALQDGILNTAKQNARSTLTSMLTGLGFEKIEFE